MPRRVAYSYRLYAVKWPSTIIRASPNPQSHRIEELWCLRWAPLEPQGPKCSEHFGAVTQMYSRCFVAIILPHSITWDFILRYKEWRYRHPLGRTQLQSCRCESLALNEDELLTGLPAIICQDGQGEHSCSKIDLRQAERCKFLKPSVAYPLSRPDWFMLIAACVGDCKDMSTWTQGVRAGKWDYDFFERLDSGKSAYRDWAGACGRGWAGTLRESR